MNYFQELLESYSRLKKRSLKLLEAVQLDPQAKGLADTYIGQASQPGIKIPVAEIPNSFVYLNDEGRIIFNGFPGARPERAVTGSANAKQNYNDFVSLLSGGGAKKTMDKGQDQEHTAQVSLLKKLFSWFPTDKFAQQLGIGLPEPPDFIKRILSNLKNPREKEWFQAATIKKFSGDSSSGSIAKMIEEGYSFEQTSDGRFKVTKTKNNLSEEVKKELSNNMLDAIEKFKKGEPLNEEECTKFKTNFKKVKRGGFVVKDNIENGNGLFFSDSSNYMNTLFGEGAKSIGCELDTVDLGKDIIGGANLRGEFLEKQAIVVHMALDCANPQKAKEYDNCKESLDALISEMEQARNEINEAILEIFEQQKEDEGEFSVPLTDEDSLALVHLARIHGPDVAKIVLQRSARFTVHGLRVRRPDFAIRVASETGAGLRDDTVEIYKSKEDAISGLVRQGMTREEAEGMIVESNLEKLCSDKQKAKTCPKDVKRNYFIVGNSMKNYIDFDKGAKLGTLSENTRKSLMLGTNCSKENCTPEEMEKLSIFSDAAKTNLGLTDTDVQSNRELEKDFSSMEENIKKLGPKLTLTKDGKQVNLNTVNKFAETFLNELKKNSDYKNLINDEMYTELKDAIKGEKDPERLKGLMKTYIKNKMLEKKINGSNPAQKRAALAYIATEAFFAGGCRNNPLFTAGSLATAELHVCRQNEFFSPLTNMLNGNNADNYEVNFDGRSIHVKSKIDDADSVTVKVMVENSGRAVTECHISKKALRKRSKKAKVVRGSENITSSRDIKLSSASMKLADMLVEFSNILKNQINS
jgi:hypothetical protein